jgi:lysophospholipase L1-like esterase
VIRRIAALGDSTSCGEGVGLRVPSGATWPARLAAATPGAELVPLAVAGARLRDVRSAQVTAALDSGADVITLLIGLNDVSRAGFDRRIYAEQLAEVVAALRDTGALLLLGRLHDATAVLPLPRGLRDVIRTRTAAVNEAADACAGDRVHLLDLAALPALRMRRAWDVDRVHPNVAGHALIADAAARVLRGAGCQIGPVRQQRLPPAPGPLREATWVLRHGLPWLGGHLPQVFLPAVASAVRLRGQPGSASTRPPVVSQAAVERVPAWTSSAVERKSRGPAGI